MKEYRVVETLHNPYVIDMAPIEVFHDIHETEYDSAVRWINKYQSDLVNKENKRMIETVCKQLRVSAPDVIKVYSAFRQLGEFKIQSREVSEWEDCTE